MEELTQVNEVLDARVHCYDHCRDSHRLDMRTNGFCHIKRSTPTNSDRVGQ
jgi:hypothetical protein